MQVVNIYINDLLEELNSSNLGVTMPRTKITALGYADDVVLLADSPSKLQAQINICERWSRRNGMSFNTTKCKILALNVGLKGLKFTVSGNSIETVTKIKYLGITLSRSRLTSLYGKHIGIVLEKAEARANAIRHMGFYKDGLRPETSIRMYKTLVRPILEYAAQVLSYKHYYFAERKCENIKEPTDFIKKLENFQNKVLKKLIPCPKNTPPEILRLLTGTMPIEGRLDMLKLRYFWKLHHAKERNEAHQIYKGLREEFLRGKEGYIHEIFNLCCKYGRIDLWHGICPKKINPLARIRKIIRPYHLKKDVEAVKNLNCVYRAMMMVKMKKYTFEERLRDPERFQSTDHRRVFLYSWLDTAKYERECKNCGKLVKDTVKHGLKECSGVEHHRKVYRLRMKFYEAPARLNLLEKIEVFEAAFEKRCWMKVVCDFLLVIWSWNYEER